MRFGRLGRVIGCCLCGVTMLLCSALAEETEGKRFAPLPIDDSPGLIAPDSAYLPDNKGYEDESLKVRIETDRAYDTDIMLAYVQIADPSQMRTTMAGRYGTTKVASPGILAKRVNAMLAINGDFFNYRNTGYLVRQGVLLRDNPSEKFDLLIIDENGDFHLVKAAPKNEQTAALEAVAKEYTIVNAFTFGPALVIDGEEQEINKEYGYNPNGKEPRAAIGQTGELCYVLAIAEGRGESSGVTQQELAHFMYGLGCAQAFNLDGGNSAEMAFGEKVIKGQPGGAERGLSDIIYFATAVPEE